MLTDDAAEQAVLRILVADGSAFQRRLTTETLRSAGRVQIDYAENVEQCLMALSYCEPDVLIADWDIDDGAGLTLVKRIRAGDAGAAFRKLAIIMVATRNSANDVQRARNVGIDEFVLRPFSTQTMLKRIGEVRAKRRDFVESTRYVGPAAAGAPRPKPMMARGGAYSIQTTNKPMRPMCRFAKGWRACIASALACCCAR